MKYDEANLLESEINIEQNVKRELKRPKKVKWLDVALVQAIICAGVSTIVMATRLISQLTGGDISNAVSFISRIFS
ncbi:MAG: hypothetical protein RR123_01690 [Clostridia bacterium]